jgi:hypothetical protein
MRRANTKIPPAIRHIPNALAGEMLSPNTTAPATATSIIVAPAMIGAAVESELTANTFTESRKLDP